MSIFKIKEKKVERLKKDNFANEKELQTFVEKNMEELFDVRFIATEFSTGNQHGGRIDSLGLDENNSPVIIEYKWGEKDNIINQGLFYLDWLVDHEGDFKLLVQQKFKEEINVNFGAPRILLIAQTFNKYDQYAINRMAENIELWGYSKYTENIFELKLIASSQSKNALKTKEKISKVNYDHYSIENHLLNKSESVKELFLKLQERLFSLEAGQKIEEKPRKMYISYKAGRSFAEVKIQENNIKIWIGGNIEDPKQIIRDVTNIGHHGIGNLEIILRSVNELDYVIGLIEQSYLQSI